MTFEEAVSKIHWGRCLLFTGAGFSLGAVNFKKVNPKFRLAWKIANELYGICGIPEEDQDGDLSRASQWHMANFPIDETIRYLNDEFTVKEISPEQRQIGSYDWKRCYTINYDEIVERVYNENGKNLIPVTPSEDMSKYNLDEICLHINGTISKLNKDTIYNEFKLTSKSYIMDYVIRRIEDGESNFIVTSDLGNGKTLFLRSLSQVLFNKGHNVYIFDNRDAPSALEELYRICQEANSLTVLIFENYGDNIDILKRLKKLRNDNIILIISERTNLYEINHYLLSEISSGEFINISLNELSNREIEHLVALIEKNGLWRKRANWTPEKKLNFIAETCKRHIGQFVLHLIKSDDLEKRFDNIVTAIKNKQEHYKALVYILVSEVLEFDLKLTDIVDDLGYDSLHNPGFRNSPYLKELIDYDNEEIIFKSSILANYILRDILDYKDIVDPLISLFKELHEKRSINRIRKQLKLMSTYNNLNKLFANKENKKGFNNAVYSYYESISDYEYNRENPLFWLQFAISRLADDDLQNAEICFDNAYSFANKTGFDTYQIDNHHARYLLRDAVKKGNLEDSIDVFREAHRKLIITRKGDEYKYYNYRVAANYLPFYNIYFNDFSPLEKLEFIRCCNEMYQKVRNYLNLEGASRKDLILETSKNLEEILSANLS